MWPTHRTGTLAEADNMPVVQCIGGAIRSPFIESRFMVELVRWFEFPGMLGGLTKVRAEPLESTMNK